VGLIDDIPTCQEMVDRFIEEAEETVRGRMAAFLTDSKSRL
jgi:hypothetical protein